MNISLTKEEWELMKQIASVCWSAKYLEANLNGNLPEKELIEFAFKKLGSEWKDDELDKDSVRYFMTEMSQEEFEERNKDNIKCTYKFNRIKND